MVATRMTGSPFKKALTAMQHGELAQVDGPQGRFLLDVPETVPVVLLAGGIGITPFRSMIKYAMERGTSHQMLLVYSNHTPADAPFLDELQHWANERDNLSLVTTMTQPEKCPPSWNGKTGRIDAEFLRKNIQDLPASVFYSAGPPRFVKAMKQSLQDAGVSEEHIHAEEFSGY